MLRWWARNSAVTTAQMVWLPRSSGPVLQHPSRKNPVIGSVPHGSSSAPNTFNSAMGPVSQVRPHRRDGGSLLGEADGGVGEGASQRGVLPVAPRRARSYVDRVRWEVTT